MEIKKSELMKKEFKNHPILKYQFMKTKIKTYVKIIDTNFHNMLMLQEGSYSVFCCVRLIDSVFKMD